MQYIVIYSDEDCLYIPQMWDKDCPGAICCGSIGDPVAVFEDRSAARKAIAISAAFATLQKAQGKVANEDFFGKCRKNLHIVPLQPAAKPTIFSTNAKR